MNGDREKGDAHSGHRTGGPPALSGLSESGAHSRPCFSERGGQAGVRVLFGVLVLFGQQVVSTMGHVECVGAQVCVEGGGGGRWQHGPQQNAVPSAPPYPVCPSSYQAPFLSRSPHLPVP